VLKAMLSNEPVDHAREHYQVTGHAVRSCRRSGVDERLLAPAEDQSGARSAPTRRSASRARLTSRPSAKRSQRPPTPPTRPEHQSPPAPQGCPMKPRATVAHHLEPETSSISWTRPMSDSG